MTTGFPYFYDKNEHKDAQKENIKNDDTFMIFSLKPLTQTSDFELKKLSTLPIVFSNSKLNFGDEFTFQFCDQISQICGTFRTIPEKQTLVLDYNGFCSLVSNSDVIISNIASELGITKDSAIEQAKQFFAKKNVVVQPTGVQGIIYKAGAYLQSAGSASLVVNTIATGQLAGVTGLQVLQAQPLLAVAVPTTGAMFFYGCDCMVGNNALGKALTTTGDILAVPMKVIEILWNSYGNHYAQKYLGIPTLLNMTQSFKTGPGYTPQEIAKYIKFEQKSILGAIKKKIIRILS